jgi:hypothetical protein
MSEKKELSQLQRQLLGGGGAITLFTQQEFDDAMDVEQGKIMMIAMQAAKKAVELEREECAKLAESMADDEEEGEICTAIRDVAKAIRTRLDKKEKE